MTKPYYFTTHELEMSIFKHRLYETMEATSNIH